MPRVRKSASMKAKSLTKSSRTVKSSPKVRKARSSKKVKRSGSRKKVNKWVSHVKAMTKKLELTYPQALRDPRVKAAYKA
jgi:hypothetical protein